MSILNDVNDDIPEFQSWHYSKWRDEDLPSIEPSTIACINGTNIPYRLIQTDKYNKGARNWMKMNPNLVRDFTNDSLMLARILEAKHFNELTTFYSSDESSDVSSEVSTEINQLNFQNRKQNIILKFKVHMFI